MFQSNKGISLPGVITVIGLIAVLASTPARADGGFYVGGSLGSSAQELALAGSGNFDESDFAWKAIVGYNFDVLMIDLAVEGSYIDFGGPEGTVLGQQIKSEADGWTAYGLAGINLGPVGVFGKAGFFGWDAKATVAGLSASDSGTDPAYGIGVRFKLFSAELRAEYEYFDIDVAGAGDADLSMFSVGAVWTF